MRKKIALVLLIGFIIPTVMARPPYKAASIASFGLVSDTTCQLCHVNPGGGSPWNSFGNALKATQGANITARLDALVAEMKDSDEDGYSDALEFFAGTLPGDAKSKPGVTVEALTQRFEDAGGLKSLHPKPAK